MMQCTIFKNACESINDETSPPLNMAIRKPAECMTKADDRILEYLNENQAGTTKAIANNPNIDINRQYLGRKLQKLAEVELVTRAGRGVYHLSDHGQGYLVSVEDLRYGPEPV